MKVLLQWKTLILFSSVCLTTKLKFLKNAMQFPHPPEHGNIIVSKWSNNGYNFMYQDHSLLRNGYLDFYFL